MKFFGKSWQSRLAALCKYIVLTLAAVLCLYPFLWVVLSSLKDNSSIYGDPFGMPMPPMFENYAKAWKGADVGRNFINSMAVCLATLAVLIVITAMGSYILTRVRRSILLDTYFSLGIMIPIHALLIPSVLIFKNLHLTDNLFSLVIMYAAVNISFSMFIMNGFMKGIPKELDEAAEIDGAGRFQRMWNITVPGLLPTFFVLLLMSIANILTNGLDQYLVFENANNKNTIEVLDLYVFHIGINGSSIPLSTVVGMFKSVISVVLLFAANGVSKKLRGESII